MLQGGNNPPLGSGNAGQPLGRIFSYHFRGQSSHKNRDNSGASTNINPSNSM